MLGQEFKPKPSTLYISLLSTILVVTLGIIISLPIAILLRLILLSLTLIYGSWMLMHYGFLTSPTSIIAIKKQNDDVWLINTNTATYKAELCGDSTVTNLISVLRFRNGKQFFPRSCVLFYDSLAKDHYRKLLVLLRNR